MHEHTGGLPTFTFITTEANELVAPIHAPKRMPVILAPEDYDDWLTGSAEEVSKHLIKPFPAEQMRIVGQGVGMKADDPARTPV